MALFEASGIRKFYGGTQALRGVDFRVRGGSVHALLGENGAGKSTLVRILTGAARPDDGELRLGGQVQHFSSTTQARQVGVAVVSQELSLFPEVDVLGNLYAMRELRRGQFLGGLFLDRAEMRRRAWPVLDSLGIHPDLDAPLAELSLAERQLVEIARALLTSPRVLVLDEPTSALEASSSARLLTALGALRASNVAVVFVSHILQEVMDLCDEVTVLRDGEVALSSVPLVNLGVPDIVSAMLGNTDSASRAGPVAISVPHIPSAGGSTFPGQGTLSLHEVDIRDGALGVTLEARPGEIVGLTGLMGAGHQSVLEVIGGLRRVTAGQLTFPDGGPVPRDLRQAIRRGLAYVTGDRKRLGLMLDKPIWENIASVQSIGLARSGGWLSTQAMRLRAQEYVSRVGIRAASVDLNAEALSGGNQQKVVLAKWLNSNPTLLLMDGLTRGVDVGAKAEMHGLIRGLAQAGAISLVCSTDLDELTGLCDRVHVFYQGRICAELSGEQLNARSLLEAMNTGRLVA
ncbi:sugar ABC transporter ATP-binding protein [Deinococcus sp. UYEF24]